MSPLQGGWYLLKPSLETFAELVDLVKHRYSSSWEPNQGWDVRNERPAGKGPCLDDDQGLFWCYFRYAQRAPRRSCSLLLTAHPTLRLRRTPRKTQETPAQ